MAQELHGRCGDDDQDLPALIAGYAVSVVPNADYASITVPTGRGQLATLAATHAYPRSLHDIQNRLGEGPDLDVAATDEPVRVDDLASGARWPAYRVAATAATPIRSSIAFRLSAGREPLGVLHVYADQTHSFGPRATEIGMTFATHAALAWDNIRREGHFRLALKSRDTIGQAKGMIMERYHVDSDGAFAMLRKMSQNSNVRLTDIAREIIAMDSASPSPPTSPQASRQASP